MDNIITLIIAVVASGGFWTMLQTIITLRQKKKSAEGRLILGLAFDRICERAEKCIEQGYITTEEYNDLNRYLYEPYREMGGNGTVERLMNRVKQLPTERKCEP